MSANAAPPTDLEIVVKVTQAGTQTRLSYMLNSPSGQAPFTYETIEGPAFTGTPQDLHRELLHQIEKLSEGLEVDGAIVLREEVEHDLAGLGRTLWDQLFSPGMRVAYRRFRSTVRTILILSDEPWIPWELVKPYDDEDRGKPLDDEFLAERFELTRWLAGQRTPPSTLAIRQFVFVAGDLPLAAKERELLLAALAQAPESPEDLSPEQPSRTGLLKLLHNGGVGLLHFAAHGTFDPARPDQAGIPLADGSVFRPDNLHGPCRKTISKDRPLVFLNVCSAGRLSWAWTGLGGWAERWVLRCGAGAFVGPQWKVRDSSAYAFAKGFYEALATGSELGQAARQGRRAARSANPGDPGWLAYAVYGHPNARAGLGEKGPSHPIPTRTAEPLHSRISPFEWLISRKIEGFVGREWLFAEIARFVRSERSGYAIVLGEPGIGKTALMAQMVRRFGHPHHFNVRRAGIQSVHHFLASIRAQLTERFNLVDSELPLSAFGDSAFLSNLLVRVSEPLNASAERLVLLVDALDESEKGPVHRGANPLYLPTLLPDGVFFVVTSRPTGDLISHQSAEHRIVLDQQEGNRADIRLYLESWLPREGIRAYCRERGIAEAVFVNDLAEMSQGNFMYLSYVLPEIEKGSYRDRDLPAGLERYYEDHWNLLRAGDRKDWFAEKQVILGALATAMEPISIALLTRISRAASPATVRACLDEWEQFIEVIPFPGSGEKTYQLYHESFRDFLEKKIDPEESSRRADEALWEGVPEP